MTADHRPTTAPAGTDHDALPVAPAHANVDDHPIGEARTPARLSVGARVSVLAGLTLSAIVTSGLPPLTTVSAPGTQL
ncbi:hypothetical protein C1701_02105 [Actinoalloteichus sp. AHMU CJ021]|uniref:hypothetical protein n=1 Tax=Actinoalloteichus TaxID=65496 RepID=UPI0004AA4B82|nr:hypothetical protein [Actinoalloteichus caeruleus]AUS77359.1 hypothetical protein C1701_02105 [Actinoalloteichus sp. AHMU CJ021]